MFFKNLGQYQNTARRVKRSTFQTDDAKLLGANVQKPLLTATRYPGVCSSLGNGLKVRRILAKFVT
jgi:hypothetical protein